MGLISVTPCAASAQQGEALTPKQVYELRRDAVVSVEVETKDGARSGTGFFYEDGRTVATALHVVKGARSILIKARGGDSWAPVSVAFDVSADTALLRLGADSGRKPIPHAPSDAVSVGDPIYVIGDPLGLTGSLSTGVVGALRESAGAPLVQITASISHGSSGGPVLDAKGRAVGIVSFTFTEGQNVNMAISTKVAKRLVSSTDAYTLARFTEVSERTEAAPTSSGSAGSGDPTLPLSPNSARAAARIKLSARFAQLYSALYAGDMKWKVIWEENANNGSTLALDRFYEGRRTMMNARYSGVFDGLQGIVREGDVPSEDFLKITESLDAITKIVKDRCDAMCACHIAALGTDSRRLREANEADGVQAGRLSNAVFELSKLVRGMPWCDRAAYEGATSAIVKADWILYRFSGIPDFDLPTTASVRRAYKGSKLKAGDVVDGIAVDGAESAFTDVADWSGFYDFCTRNWGEGKTRFKIRVKRGSSRVVVHQDAEGK